MAKKSELSGIHPCEDEIVIDVRPDGKVSTPWLTQEGQEILSEIGKEPREFERISSFCG
jgi:hypothetical protein